MSGWRQMNGPTNKMVTTSEVITVMLQRSPMTNHQGWLIILINTQVTTESRVDMVVIIETNIMAS